MGPPEKLETRSRCCVKYDVGVVNPKADLDKELGDVKVTIGDCDSKKLRLNRRRELFMDSLGDVQ